MSKYLQTRVVEVGDDAAVLSLWGEIDLATADELSGVIHAALTRVSRLEIDCAGVTFVDSFGAGRLLSAHLESGRLRLVNVTANVVRVFSLLGIDGLLGLRSPARPTEPLRAAS